MIRDRAATCLAMATALALGFAYPVVVSADDTPSLVLTPSAKIQTTPVPTEGDAADDVAIWIRPSDPGKSLVFGTDKKDGLHAYSLVGKDVQLVSPGSKPNNIDILYGFPIEGKATDLVIGSVGKGGASAGLKIWTIDQEDGKLQELGEGPTCKTFDGGDPYGLCTYRSPAGGAAYVFVTDREGAVEQYRLDPLASADRSGRQPIEATRVRSFQVGSQSEGIVADREHGRLYIAEENVGLWEYGAEPSDGAERRSVAKVGENGLTADLEGLALYYGPQGQGYLIVSSQGSSTYHLFQRNGDHRFVATIDPKAGPSGIDDVAHTDGIDVTNERTSDLFPRGLLVVQDGENEEGRQNFKLFAWDELAGDHLLVDTTAKAR